MRFSSYIYILLGLFAGVKAYPCSSCGSGAADPLVLSPLEDQKFYLGFSQQSHFKDYDSTGSVRRDLGPERKRQFEVAFAQRINSKVFASGVSGLGVNERGSRREAGILDTSLNLRYTPLLQSMAEPWIPQLQLILSHRFRTTRSVQDARKENYLDSFGAGYDETFYGADLWFGMFPVLFGGSVLRSYPWGVSTQNGRLIFGVSQKEILTLGGMLGQEAKLIGGLTRERRGGIEQDGVRLPRSDKMSHDLFITFETLRPSVDNFRVSFNRRASWGQNKNATQSSSFTLAWMRTL